MTQQMDNKVKGPSIRLSTVATSTRQTAKTDFGTVMRDGLIRAGDIAVSGLQIAAPFIPGSAIVSAAVAGANLASNVAGGGPVAQGGGGGGGGASPSYGSGFGVGAAGLSSGPGGGPAAGGATLGLPGRGPGYSTNLNQSPSSFAPGGASAGNVDSGGAASSDAFARMMGATRQMAEFQASFNLQYLQLQEKIQQDTRQFNLVSNIMKTKHDAAKNALNNVR